MRLIFDSHLDLGWCAAHFGRDLTQPVAAIRQREQGMTDEKSRGRNVLSLPELRRAGVAVCVATLLARSGPEHATPPTGYGRTGLDYTSPAAAFTAAHAQLAWYRLMEQQGQMRQIRTRGDLDAHWAAYTKDPQRTPLGYILSMEGADPVIEPRQLQYWWDLGLRAIGPAHYGRGRYAYGTATDGPIGDAGRALLTEMRRLGFILDVTHLTDTSQAEATAAFDGPLLASHHNCRALVPGDRQLTDEQIKQITRRGAVIGVALDAWMLYPNWQRGVTQPEVVGLETLADHIDRICDLAGDRAHAAIGTDLDGGFGYEQTPRDLNVYSDLRKLADILASRKYSDSEIDAVFHNNWLHFFRENLPA
jgi:membrane dipeptidase